jgi:TolA-binding protein
MPDKPKTILPASAIAREAVRVMLAMTTAAGTVYTSVRSALSDHESRIGSLESRQNNADERAVPRREIEAHWEAISQQLAQIEQDLRDMRLEQHDITKQQR